MTIAQKLNRSYDTIKSKFESLKKQRILIRCAPKINLKTLGYSDNLCLFNLSPDKEKNNQFIKDCLKQPNVIRYSKCLGHFNLILNIHTKNTEELKKILSQLKKNHHKIINFYEIIPLTSD